MITSRRIGIVSTGALLMCLAAAAAQAQTVITANELGRFYLDVGMFADGDTTQSLTPTGEPTLREALRTPGAHVGIGARISPRLDIRVEAQWPRWSVYDHQVELLDCAERTCVRRMVDRREAGRTPSVSGVVALLSAPRRRMRLGAVLGLGFVFPQQDMWDTPQGTIRTAAPTIIQRSRHLAVSYGVEAAIRLGTHAEIVPLLRGHVGFGLSDDGLAVSRGRLLRPGVGLRWHF